MIWLIFFIIIPIILLILYLTENAAHPNSSLKYFYITCFVGSFFVSIIFTGLFIIKRNWIEFSKMTIPTLVILLWILIYLPFLAIFPMTLMKMSSSDANLAKSY